MHGCLARFHVLSTTCFLCSLLHASGHAYVYWPTARVRLNKFPWLAHSNNVPKNVGNVDPRSGYKDFRSKHGAGPPGRNGPRTDTAWAWDLCGRASGDPGGSVTPAIGASWKDWATPPVATYKQGGQITFTIVVNGEHGGVHEFRLCPKKVDGRMNLREAAECLDMYLIGRECTKTPSGTPANEQCSCSDDKCCQSKGAKCHTPHNDPNDPIFSHGKPEYLEKGAHLFTFNLPKGVSCEECTIQWFWDTAFGEWFRNCIDIKIEGTGGGGGATPSPPSPVGTTPSPDQSRRRTSSRRRARRRRSSRRRRRSTRRRRTTSRRRVPRRRRRKQSNSRRRHKDSGVMAAASGSADTLAASHGTLVDIEYEEYGCFPLAAGDVGAAAHLDCDCDTGSGPRLYDTAPRDFTCMHHRAGTLCRSGLPFFRLLVNREGAARLCFSWCSGKGADLFGLLGWGDTSSSTAECRCGATITNRKFWEMNGLKFGNPSPESASGLPHPSLLLDGNTRLQDCPSHAVRVYSYEGWKRLGGSSGVQDAMLDLGSQDNDYIASIVAGHRIKDGTPEFEALT